MTEDRRAIIRDLQRKLDDDVLRVTMQVLQLTSSPAEARGLVTGTLAALATGAATIKHGITEETRIRAAAGVTLIIAAARISMPRSWEKPDTEIVRAAEVAYDAMRKLLESK